MVKCTEYLSTPDMALDFLSRIHIMYACRNTGLKRSVRCVGRNLKYGHAMPNEVKASSVPQAVAFVIEIYITTVRGVLKYEQR